jgi:hypothetical protein
VEVPEEGALLAVAWLLAHGHADAARAVLDEIAPFFPRLRFYPIPHDRPLADHARVHLQPVGHTVRQLHAIRAPERVLVQRGALRLWAPLADRTVELFMGPWKAPPRCCRRTQAASRCSVTRGGTASQADGRASTTCRGGRGAPWRCWTSIGGCGRSTG